MSTTIDERVVEMRFDNQHFEKNVQTSMNTLDELNKKLQLDNASKGLESVNRAAKNVDISGLGQGVEAIQAKFSALQVIGVTALSRLTNAAITAGIRIGNAITNSLTQGGITRAMNIEQAKFQLEGLGASWKTVEADIEYAVKGTAYGLDVAAKACSQLIASNVTAGDEMKTALRGISGLAAMTNSSYEDIANIFTTVAGNGRLMGEQLLQISSRGINAAATLAKHLGVTEQEVREMVSDGEINFETFAEAMDTAFGEHAKDANKTFSGSLANMKAALSRIGADVAGPGLTNLRDIFNALRVDIDHAHETLGPFIAALNKAQTGASKFIVKFLELKGLQNLLSGLGNIFKGLWSVIVPIKDAFVEIFPPKSAEQVADMMKKFSDFTAKLKLGESQTQYLKTAFKGLFSAIETLITYAKSLAGGLGKIFSNFDGIGNGLLSVLASIGTAAKAVIDIIGEKIVMPGLEGLLSILQSVWNFISDIGSRIPVIMSDIGNSFSGIFTGSNVTAGLGLAGVIFLLRDAIIKISTAGGAFGRFMEMFKGVFISGEKIKSIFSGLSASVWKLSRTLEYEQLVRIARAIALLAGSILVISLIDTKKLSSSLSAISILFTNLMVSMSVFDKMNLGGTSFLSVVKFTSMIGTLTTMAFSILILAGALKTISNLDTGEMIRGVAGIAALTGIMIGMTKAMSKIEGGGLKGVGKLIVLGVALKLLASVCKDLSTLEWEELGKGLAGVGGLIVAVVGFMRLAKFGKGGFSNMAGLILMASALKTLTGVVKELSSMNIEELKKGLGSIGVLLAELALFTRGVGNPKGIISTSVGMILIANAITIFSKSVKYMAGMSVTELLTGLGGLAGVLAAVVLAMRAMPKNMVGKGLGLIAVAAGVNTLAESVKSLGGSDWSELGRGVGAIAATLLILAGALHVMNGTLAGSAALLIAASALTIIAKTIKTLGNLELSEIIKGLGALAGVFIVLGLASVALAPLIPAMLALAGTFAVFGAATLALGAGIALVGVGLTAFAAGLASLSGSLAVSVAAIVSSITIIVNGILELIPDIAVKIVEGLVAICVAILDKAPILIDTLIVLIKEVLASLAQHAPSIVDSLMVLLIGIIDSVAERLPELITAVMKLLGSLFKGVADALKSFDIGSLKDAVLGVGTLSVLIYALSSIVGLIPSAMVGILGMGVVIAELGLVLAALGGFAQIPGLSWLISEGGNFLESIGTAIGQFVGGLAGGIAKGATSALPEIGSDLSAFMLNAKDFIDGIKGIDATVMSGVESLANAVLALTSANLLERLLSWSTGSSALATFGEDLAAFGPHMKTYSDAVVGIDTEAVATSAKAVSELAKASSEIPKEGGWAGAIFGENGIAGFANQLPIVGTALKSFSTNLGTFTDEQVNSVRCASNAIKTMAEAGDSINGQSGWGKALFGDDGIGAFSSQLPEVGTNLKQFASNVGTFGEDKITTVNTVVKVIKSFASLGSIDLSSTSSNLPIFGKRLVAFADDLISFCSKAEVIKDNTVGTTLSNLVKSISTTATDITKKKTAFESAGSSLMNGLKSGINNGKESVHNTCTSLVGYLKNGITSKKDLFDSAGERLVTSLKTGIDDKKDSVKKTVEKLIDNAADAISDCETEFESAGKDLGNGLVNGIEAKYQAAYDAGYTLGQKAVQGEKDGQQSKSPSKLTFKAGKWIGEGLINGMVVMGRKVYNTGYDLGNNAAASMSDAVSRISEFIDSDIESQPTIRPVIDLTNVRNGVGTINSMFGDTQIGAINSTMSGRNQNGTNNDVVSAINKLRNDIGNINNNSYSIGGITYNGDNDVAEAIETLVRASIVGRRV